MNLTENTKEYAEKECAENCAQCQRFDNCSKNICPLDFNIHLRTNPEGRECPYMAEEITRALSFNNDPHKQVNFGGKVMPEEALKYVPEFNAEKLNKASSEKYRSLQLSKT